MHCMLIEWILARYNINTKLIILMFYFLDFRQLRFKRVK